jgi:GntR family transcriptional regulator
LAIKIAAGDYRPGEWLPSGEAIGREFGAERGTVRRALRMLAERGLVEVVEGNGAKVAQRVVTQHSPADMTQPANGWRGFGAAALRAGQEPYVDVRSVREVEALPHVARWLGVPIGTVTLERDRVHGIVEAGERKPVEIATTWIKLSVVERVPMLRQPDTGTEGMTARLIEAGYEPRYEDVVTSRHGDADEQERLQVDGQQSLTVVWRRTYDQTDQIIKVSQRVINPLRHKLSYRYP